MLALSSTPSIAGYASIVFNFVAAFILLCALFPPWLEARKTKSTFGISFGFLNNYILAGVFVMSQNLITFLLVDDVTTLVLMALFFTVQIFSLTINFNLKKMKKANCAAAAAKNMSEQDYWEKYFKGAKVK